jgi:hypothetical protein
MISVPLTVRFFVATGTAAVLVGCSSGGGSTDSADSEPTTTPSSSAPSPSEDAAEQTYLDAVNALCDDLLPKVLAATGGGSLDITAAQYLKDWPGHEKVLDEFDTALAAVPVPPSAQDAAGAMASYVVFADSLDAARLEAAQQGEDAWRAEVAAEADAASDPAIEARNAAGFADSCDAR